MENGEYYSRIFFIIVFALLVIATFWIVYPLMQVIVGAILITYIFYPVYKFIFKLTNKKNTSAMITLILIILVSTVPLFYIGNVVTKESLQLYFIAKQKLASGKLIDIDCSEEDASFVCKINQKTQEFVSNPKYKFYLETILGKVTNFVVEKATDVIISLPQIFMGLFIMFFTIFFLLKDHEIALKKIKDWIPLKKSHKESIIKEFNDFSYATIYGQFIVSLAQGAVATLFYFIFGVNSPVIWGLLTAFVAFIPFLGPPLIWIPLSLHLILNNEIINGAGLFIAGMLVISTVDNFIKPKIIGDRTRLHPVLVLIGIIGGLFTMGFMGVILGPLIISLLISFIEVYHEEEKRKTTSS